MCTQEYQQSQKGPERKYIPVTDEATVEIFRLAAQAVERDRRFRLEHPEEAAQRDANREYRRNQLHAQIAREREEELDILTSKRHHRFYG